MVYVAADAIICANFLLYAIFSMNEFRQGKKIRGIVFFLIMVYIGLFVNICMDYDWKIAEMISAGDVIKIAQMAVIFLFGGLFLRGGAFRTILSVAISDVIAAPVELLWQVSRFCITNGNISGFHIINAAESNFFQVILFFILYFLAAILLHPFFLKIRKIPFEKSWFAKIIACFYMAAGFSPVVNMMHIVGGNTDFLFCLIVDGSVLLGFTALFLWERNKTYRQKNMYLFLQEQMIKEHVRLMEDQIMLTRRFRHDIRKHFDMVSYFLDKNPEYADSQQLSEYKRDLCGMYHSLSRGDYCDMMDVNAIIYQLEQFCKKNRVSFAAKLKNMVCKNMKPEKRCDIFFGAVNWAMEICKDYEEKERLSVELSGETTAGRSIFAVTVKLKKSVDEINSHSNLCVSSQSIWQERLKKSLASCDGFWKTEKEPGMCRLVVSWAENT